MIMIRLNGKIDSNNAAEWEKKIAEQLEGYEGTSVEIDASDLEYISSAGLRVLLRIRKTHPQIRIFDVNPVVYEILDTTGFTQMMEVEKAYRVISIEGCEEIGRGANGTIYRIDQDNVVKVYNNPEALSDIQHERELPQRLVEKVPHLCLPDDLHIVPDKQGRLRHVALRQSDPL